MQTAYKYFPLGDSIAILFEEAPFKTDSIDFVRDEQFGNMLVIGGKCQVPLSPEFMKIFSNTQGLYYAQSRKEDFGVEFTAFVPLDRLVIGKILAFCEMEDYSR